MALLYHLGVLLALLTMCQSEDPGAYLQLDSCALKNVVIGILSNKETLRKMGESQEAKKALGQKGHSPIKGISHIKMEKLEFSNISLTFLSGIGIQMFVTNKIQISGKSFLGGKTEMKMEVNIITKTSLEKGDANCPKIVKTDCTTILVKVEANLPKGILPNVMNNFLDKNLKKLLPSTLCPAVDFILSEVNKRLCTKDISLPFGKSGSLHYMESPISTVTEEHVEIEFNAQVFNGENTIYPSENTTNSFVLPSYQETTTLFLTSTFLGCAFTVFQEEGAFNLLASEDDLANSGAMSVSTLSDILPELPGGLQDYKINISVNKSAQVTLDSSKALLHLYSTMEVTASSPDSTLNIFIIYLHMNFKIQFSVNENSLNSVLSLDRTFLSLESSSVGQFDVEDLKEFVTSVIEKVYTPAINVELQTAIPLPDIIHILDINFDNAQIETDKDILLIPVNVCKAWDGPLST
ncbi:BPI fold-containing family B member 6 [Pseudophryne corroboree]|uniref:BPI fold-containing family B member 6 n=1 Tax=Pseudophryne corroboree TaxID=495146 RepID=UPI0030821DA7